MQEINCTDMRNNKDIRYYTKYAKDPQKFIEKYIGIKLLDWQLDIINNPVKKFIGNNDENFTVPIAIAGANTTGKSFFGKCLMVWHFCCIENSRSFILTNSEKQTKGVNYGEIKDMLCNLFDPSVIKIQDVIHFANDEDATSDKWSIEYQRTSRVKSSNTGHHKPRMLFFFDEATEFKDTDWDALTTKMMSKRVLVYCCGNPHITEANSGFRKIFENAETDHDGIKWYTKNINLIEDLPNTMYNEDVIRSIISLDGVESDKYRCMVLGQFPRDTSTTRFPISILRKNMNTNDRFNNGSRVVMGVDMSENDRNGSVSAIAIRSGSNLISVRSYSVEISEFRQILFDEIFNKRPNLVVMDSNGVGNGLFYETVARYGRATHIVGVKFQESPSYKDQFANKKSELYWKASEWIRMDVKMPKDHAFANALSNIRFNSYSGKIATDSKADLKKRIGKQFLQEIDKIDSFCLTFAEDSLLPIRDYTKLYQRKLNYNKAKRI